jgi:hypothetical protein
LICSARLEQTDLIDLHATKRGFDCLLDTDRNRTRAQGFQLPASSSVSERNAGNQLIKPGQEEEEEGVKK